MNANRAKRVADRFLQCRVVGHQWKYEDAWKEGQVYRQTLICRSCSTVRKDTINGSNGEMLGKSYEYPDGYLMVSGTKLNRGKLRIRQVVRGMGDR